MDSKPEIANELEARMTRLSELLGRFAKLPGDPQRMGFLETITELRRYLRRLASQYTVVDGDFTASSKPWGK